LLKLLGGLDLVEGEEGEVEEVEGEDDEVGAVRAGAVEAVWAGGREARGQ